MGLEIGNIIASRGDSIISSVIKKITYSKYSHLAIIVSNTLIIEADGISGFIKYRNIEDFQSYSDIFTCDSLTDKKSQEMIFYLEGKVGQKYDRILLFWLFVKYVFRVKLPYKNDSSMICSELVNNAYKSVGVRLSKKRFPSPKDIINSKLLRKIGSL